MNYHSMKAIILILLIALVFTTAPPASIANCFILAPDSSCQQCLFGYTLHNSTCVKAQQLCKTFFPSTGVCDSCFVGYRLVAYTSCQIDPNSSLLQGCARPLNNICLACSAGYYYNFEGNCQLIDTLCQYFNYASKRCGTCYPGNVYIMSQGKCGRQIFLYDSNCTLWQNGQCLLCDNGYYFDNRGFCVISNPNCQSFNQSNSSQCLSCYPAYNLVNNTCVLAPQSLNNRLCATYDVNNVCTSCLYSTTVLNAFKICVPVNPFCFTFDTNGNCLSCYKGYVVNKGTCITAQQQAQDNYCAVWSSNTCLACAPWAYFDSQHVCKAVSIVCQTFDSSNGQCTSCYLGWTLFNGSCWNYASTDLNCQNTVNNVCKACYGGYFYNQTSGKCQVVNSLCLTFDKSGKCLSCYHGYGVKDGVCVVSQANCCSINADGTCAVCINGYHVTQSHQCVSNSENCLNYSIPQMFCYGCEYNFKNVGGACYPIIFINPTNTTISDPNCAVWSVNHTVCLSCISRAFFNSSGACQKVSDFCSTFNSSNGRCLTCYSGYIISGSTCILGSTSCNSSDKSGKCLSCYPGNYLSNGSCYQIDSFCANFNYTSLSCDQCYGGYHLANKTCQIST